MSSRIDLYVASEAKGVDPWCAEVMKSALERTVDKRFHEICVINELDTTLSSDLKSLKAFVIPGGHAGMVLIDIAHANQDLKLTKLLQTVGYYGSCSGAIIATSNVHPTLKDTQISIGGYPIGNISYNKNIVKKRGNFPGNILAPFIFNSPHDEFSEKNFIFKDLTASIGNQNKTIQTVHMEGPVFLEPEKIPGTKVLATYEDSASFYMASYDRSWTITKTYENQSLVDSVFYKESTDAPGMVLASSHPEINAFDMLRESTKQVFTLTQQKVLHDKLKDGDENRNLFFKQNLELLGIKVLPN
jgi:glutamine amidotransferase-like uncharacterized protein